MQLAWLNESPSSGLLSSLSPLASYPTSVSALLPLLPTATSSNKSVLLRVIKRPSSSSFTSSPGVTSSCRAASPGSLPLFPWAWPLGLESQSSQSCRSLGQSQGCCQQTSGKPDLLPSLPWGHRLVVPAAGCLKPLLTGCTQWIYPLNPMTFPVLINNAKIFRDHSSPSAFSLGHPSAAAQV